MLQVPCKRSTLPPDTDQNSTRSLTPSGWFVSLRRFREYPERAVMKRRKWQASRLGLRYTGYKRFTAGFSGSLGRIETYCGLAWKFQPIYRACATLHPGWAMRAGTAKRSWAAWLKSQATSATVDCYSPEGFCCKRSSSTAACRIQNFAEACLHASPFARSAEEER
jgi:hypothetical protein